MILDDEITDMGEGKDDEEDTMSSSSGISSSSFSNSSMYNRERTEKMLDEILEDENEDIFNDDIWYRILGLGSLISVLFLIMVW